MKADAIHTSLDLDEVAKVCDLRIQPLCAITGQGELRTYRPLSKNSQLTRFRLGRRAILDLPAMISSLVPALFFPRGHMALYRRRRNETVPSHGYFGLAKQNVSMCSQNSHSESSARLSKTLHSPLLSRVGVSHESHSRIEVVIIWF